MPSNLRTSFRFASGNNAHNALSETLISAIYGGCPRRPRRAVFSPAAALQPLGQLHQPKQALPADNRRAHARLANDPRTMNNRLRAPGRT
jgi:hypothetical protein